LFVIITEKVQQRRIFKGCCIKQHDTVGDNVVQDTDTINIINTMANVIDSQGYYIQKGSRLYFNDVSDNRSYASSHVNDDDKLNGIEWGFGGLANKTVMVLSHHHLLPGEIHYKQHHSTFLQDREDYHLFMNMIESAKSQEQKERICAVISQLTVTFLAENCKKKVASDETTFLGEDDSKGYRSGKRHKQQHEKWSRKHKN